MSLKLKAKRVERGIKQKQLAEILGVSPQYIYMLENGLAEPRRDLMIKISGILDASVSELFFEEKSKGAE